MYLKISEPISLTGAAGGTPPRPPSATPSLGLAFFSAEFASVPISLARRLQNFKMECPQP